MSSFSRMCIMQPLSHRPPSLLASPAALSLLEVLLTLTLLTLLMALTGGALATLTSWRGLSAIQQLAADLDEARAQALTEPQEVWVAFAGSNLPGEAFRAYARCRPVTGSQGERWLQPDGDWQRLPAGQVFSLSQPATQEAGRNLLAETASLQPVRLAGGLVELPCLGFGSLGQLIHPPFGQPLLALAEGEIHHGQPRQKWGPGAEPCRWLVLHRHTGNALLLP